MDWNLAQEKVLKGEASGFVVKDNLPTSICWWRPGASCPVCIC